MNKAEIRQILNLNEKFYQSVSKDFSNSRKYPWKGWDRVVKEFKDRMEKGRELSTVKIMDLGCGNARFYDFIISKIENVEYTGVDINNDLLLEAERKHKKKMNNRNKFNLIKKDIFTNISKLRGKYDLVTAFGLTHHIPDDKFRSLWYLKLPSLVAKNGLLVLTFWNFSKSKGDFLIGWGNENVARYCHNYSNKEIKDIVSSLNSKGLILLSDFKSDNENRYLVFGRI